jgi:gliding motility-associated-like protein
MRVYDRWGKMVYTTTDPQGGWDGSVQGMAAGAGVYMYEVSFAGGTNRKAQFQKGDITLIR